MVHADPAGVDHSVKAVSRFFNRFYETADGVPGDAKEFYNGVVPDRRVEYFSNDPRLDEARRGFWLRTSSGYRFINSLSDAMRVTRYLTVTPGLALTSNQAGTNLAGTVISQTVLTPHLAVAWDPLHDGRTVVRASFNQYVDTDAVRIARHALGDGVSRECRCNPASGEYDIDCRYSGGQHRPHHRPALRSPGLQRRRHPLPREAEDPAHDRGAPSAASAR